MSIRRASSFVWCPVLAVLFTVACDNEPLTTVSGPSVTGSTGGARASATQGISVSPSQIQPLLILGASCPDPRFVAPFTLNISGNGFSDVFLAQVDMQFVDRIGVTTPMHSITRTALIERFGSTRITALETRTFPLEFPLGCASAPAGTLIITVALNDTQQRERRTMVSMPVR